VVSDGGSLLFVDLEDFTVREDKALNDKYRDAYGWFDLEGITMTNYEKSTYLYLGMENMAVVLEYDWRDTQRIYRRFDLPGLGNEGIQSLTWVPTEASTHQGYFYMGSRAKGSIFIYELPLLDSAGPEAQATLRDRWTPLEGGGDRNIAGLAYSAGYIFVSYDDVNSNHVLIYPILANGLYGELAEQYQVDVVDSQGIAVRLRANNTWEVYFTSDSQAAVFAYTFQFVTGFELHGHCNADGISALAPPGPHSAAVPGRFSAAGLGPFVVAALAAMLGCAASARGKWDTIAG